MLHFAKHYVEMVIAMFVGMFALGGLLTVALAGVGIDVGDWREDSPALLLLGMAFTMTVPMVAWMRYRGHGWAPCWEMSGAMFVPTFVALALLWTSVEMSTHGLMMIQHIAMFPAMLGVMLLRRDEYSH